MRSFATGVNWTDSNSQQLRSIIAAELNRPGRASTDADKILIRTLLILDRGKSLQRMYSGKVTQFPETENQRRRREQEEAGEASRRQEKREEEMAFTRPLDIDVSWVA